jgi:hypothetical protein
VARCYNYVDCFEEADPGSLWGPKCRAANALVREERAGERMAQTQAAVARWTAEDAARLEVECEGRCGKLVPNARRRQVEQVEVLRRQVQRKLMTGQVQVDGGPVTDSLAAYCRAIELTAPHRLQQARNLCDICLAKRMEDAVIFLGDGP